MNRLTRIFHAASSNVIVLGAAGTACLWFAYQSAFNKSAIEFQSHECHSSFGRAVMGLDEYNASFITLYDRFGSNLYEAARMYPVKERRDIVDTFCATGKTPELRSEKVVGSWPANYYCEGLNGQKAAVFPKSRDVITIIRSHPAAKPLETTRATFANGIWHAQRHCKGIQ